MSHPQSSSNSYYNNLEEAEDSNSVFDADTVVPDEVPSTEDHRQLCNNNEALSSCHSQESPATTISELLRRINSQHPAMPSPSTTTTTTTASNKEKEVSSNHSHPPSLSSSSSSKRLLRRCRSSRNQKELQKKSETSTQPRRSSRVNAKPADQSYVENSDLDDDEFEDYEPDEAAIDPSSSSHQNFTSTSETNGVSYTSVNRPRRSSRLKVQPADQSYADRDSNSETEYEDLDQSDVEQEDQPNTIEATVINHHSSSSQSSRIASYNNKWKRKFRELCAYKQLHGHINIICNDKQLGKWVYTQRQEYKKWKKNRKSKMTSERIRMLNSIDFQWRIRSDWDEKFQELCAFKEQHKHVNVPRTNKNLRQWVSYQRIQYKRLKENTYSCMTEERIQKLESIGFKWVGHNLVDVEWGKRFSELSDFKDIYGHVNVPYSHSDKRLSNWVSSQRYQYNRKKANKSSNITRERIQMLESIGFVWSLPRGGKRNESEWDKKFTELCEYKELHGNTNVTRENKDYKSLGLWVRTQRDQFNKFRRNKKSAITENRIQLLNSIGFQWVRRGKK